MRIIAGRHKGRRLKTLPGTAIRPTSDRLRETLFNILAPWIQDAVFIDCYAGTGAVGVEALSRGARQVYLIESDPAATSIIESNLAFLPSHETIPCWRMTGHSGLKRLAAMKIQADICYLDPPYPALTEALEDMLVLVKTDVMRPEGWIILEHAKRDATPESIGAPPQQWQRTRLLTQGTSALSFYRMASVVVSKANSSGTI